MDGVEVKEAFELESQVALAEAHVVGGTREIRAVHDEHTVRVYQAYNASIASAAVEAQRFVPPWKEGRMTWIKPSFVWMGYRCGWTRKDANQSRVLAIDLHRASFDKLLLDAVLASAQQGERSDRDDSGASAAIVVQWDPERALGGDSGRHAFTHPLPAQRSLQMGLRGEATRLLAVADGIVAAITDVTSAFAAVGAALEAGEDTSSLLPVERPYPLPEGCAIADRSVATAAAEVAVAQGGSGSELRSLNAGSYRTPGATLRRSPHLVPRPGGVQTRNICNHHT